MLHITEAQKAALDRERREKYIKRIDDWLLQEDRAWPQAAADQRVQILDALLTYGEQSGMETEVDYAVFCRAAILMRANWRAFVEAPAQRTLLLDERTPVHSKLRAFHTRAEMASAQGAGAPA